MLFFEKTVLFIARNPADNETERKELFSFLPGKDLFMVSRLPSWPVICIYYCYRTMEKIITTIRGELLYRLGDRKGYMFLSYTMGVLLIINFLAAGFIRLSKRFLIIALAGLLLLVGRELVFLGLQPLFFLPGLILLVLGTFIFSRQIGLFYLWV
ncbi:hypothetical protein ES708_10294 [subsurface metagenome]